MEVDDMFGANDQEEIVEEEVPVSVVPATQSGEMFGSNVAASTSASSIPAYTSPMSTTIASSSSFGNYSYGAEEDTSAFKAWKAKHDVELEERAAKEQKTRADSRAQGRAELDKLLADHSAKVQKTKKANRENEASAPNTQAKEGDEWEQVASYMGSKIEREGARDTSRFREIVFKQKH